MIVLAPEQAPPPADPWLLALPAIIGLCGVILGGTLQVIAKHRADRYEQLNIVRGKVIDLTESMSDLAAVLVQASIWMEEQMSQYSKDLESGITDPETELEGAMHERLLAGQFDAQAEAQKQALSLITAPDSRISNIANKAQLLIIDTINETGHMLADPKKSVPPERARKLSDDLMELANIMINMVSPRRQERFWHIRSEKKARKSLKKARAKKESIVALS